MVFNRHLGKKKICEAMLGHTAARYGFPHWLQGIGKQCGFFYIKLFGYPFDTASRILARKTLRLLNRDKKGTFLDVGCSHGTFDFELARQGYSVIGIDTNQESIEVGNRIKEVLGVGNVTFYRMDILDNRFGVKTFDGILMYETLEHIKEDARVLRELHRILKDDGALLLSVPYSEVAREYENPIGALKARGGGLVCVGEGGGHYRDGYDLEQIRALLEKSGFRMVTGEYVCFPKCLEASVFTFPFKFPLSLLWTHFSRNRMKVRVIAQKR
jgi:SAM-dependent methyltransferase